MIKTSICALSLFGTVFSLSAQNRLNLKVIDQESQKIVSGATVQILSPITKETKSNANGEVYFDNLPNGTYQLMISHLGYALQKKEFVLPNSKTNLLYLVPRSIKTEEVLVQATRANQHAASTFKNLSKDEIAKNNIGQDIPYLLDQTPSVVISSDAGAGIGYTGMTIRGSDNSRINVTLNGIPLNDAESMGSFFVNLPDFASSTESIQIQRGIGTSSNGAGSFGASLNIQSAALEKKPYAELNNSFGSYNSWKNTVKFGTGLLDNKFAFNARLSHIGSNGFIEKAQSNLNSFYFDAGYYAAHQQIKAVVFYGKEKTYQAWYGVPEPIIKNNPSQFDNYASAMEIYDPNEIARLKNAGRNYNIYTYDNQTDNYTQKHHQLHYSNFISDKLTYNASLHYTRGYGYYEEYRPDEKLAKYNLPDVVFAQDTISSSNLVRQRWLDNYFYGATTSIQYQATSNLNLIWGAAYNQYKGEHYGKVIWSEYASTGFLEDNYYHGNSRKNDFSTFIKADYKLENWLLMLDVQYRNIDYKTYGDDDKIKNYSFHPKYNFINPKIGFTYLIDQRSNVYASYAYASKEPVRKDFVEKNTKLPDPKPEKMQDIEVGYRLKDQKFNIGINGYGMFYKDQLIQTGQINDVGGPIRQNTDNSYRVGLEFDGAWRISDQWTWKATATFSQNKIKDFTEYAVIYDDNWNNVGMKEITYAKTNIILSPNTILSNEFAYSPISKLTLAFQSKYVSKQFLDNTSSDERSLDAYFVNALRSTYTFNALGLKSIDLNLHINNVFNQKYESNGYTWGSFDSKDQRSFYNFYFPQAGTNFMLGLNVKF